MVVFCVAEQGKKEAARFVLPLAIIQATAHEGTRVSHRSTWVFGRTLEHAAGTMRFLESESLHALSVRRGPHLECFQLTHFPGIANTSVLLHGRVPVVPDLRSPACAPAVSAISARRRNLERRNNIQPPTDFEVVFHPAGKAAPANQPRKESKQSRLEQLKKHDNFKLEEGDLLWVNPFSGDQQWASLAHEVLPRMSLPRSSDDVELVDEVWQDSSVFEHAVEAMHSSDQGEVWQKTNDDGDFDEELFEPEGVAAEFDDDVDDDVDDDDE